MRLFLFVIAFSAIVSHVFSAGHTLDSVVTYNVDGTGQNWFRTAATYYSFDEQGNCQSVVTNNFSLGKQQQSVYVYTPEGNVSELETYHKTSQESNYTLDSKLFRFYDDAGLLLRDSVTVSTQQNGLFPTAKIDYAYSPQGELLYSLTHSYKFEDSSWYLPTIDTVIYNTDNTIAVRMKKYRYDDLSRWTQLEKYEFFYTDNSVLDSLIFYDYDLDKLSLVKREKVEYSKDGLSEIYSVFDAESNLFEPTELIAFVVDSAKEKSNYALPPVFSFPTEYLPNTKIYLQQDLVGGTWVESSRDIYYWSDYQAVDIPEPHGGGVFVSVYTGNNGTELNIVSDALVSDVSIFSVSGNAAIPFSEVNYRNGMVQLPVDFLPHGYYVASMLVDGIPVAKPFVK